MGGMVAAGELEIVVVAVQLVPVVVVEEENRHADFLDKQPLLFTRPPVI